MHLSVSQQITIVVLVVIVVMYGWLFFAFHSDPVARPAQQNDTGLQSPTCIRLPSPISRRGRSNPTTDTLGRSSRCFRRRLFQQFFIFHNSLVTLSQGKFPFTLTHFLILQAFPQWEEKKMSIHGVQHKWSFIHSFIYSESNHTTIISHYPWSKQQTRSNQSPPSSIFKERRLWHTHLAVSKPMSSPHETSCKIEGSGDDDEWRSCLPRHDVVVLMFSYVDCFKQQIKSVCTLLFLSTRALWCIPNTIVLYIEYRGERCFYCGVMYKSTLFVRILQEVSTVYVHIERYIMLCYICILCLSRVCTIHCM